MRLRNVAVLAMGAMVALGPVVAVATTAGAGVSRSATAAAARAARVAGTLKVPGSAPFLPGTTVPGVGTGARSFDKVTSSNWSGYAVQSASAFTGVVGSWTQPAVTCTSKTTYSAFWVGIDGYADSTVEQLGTEADCVGGVPAYSAWYEMYPKAPVTFGGLVEPGDVLTATVTRSGTSYDLSITDSTAGWAQGVVKKSAAAEDASAEWIAEAPCCTASGGILPLSDFGSVAFTGAEAATGGGDLPISSFPAGSGPHEISMTKNSKVIAKPSALGSHGQAFTVTYK